MHNITDTFYPVYWRETGVQTEWGWKTHANSEKDHLLNTSLVLLTGDIHSFLGKLLKEISLNGFR